MARAAVLQDAAPSDPVPGEEVLNEVYGPDSAKVRAAVEEAARRNELTVDWNLLQPWDMAYNQFLDMYEASWMRERSAPNYVAWPGVDLLRPVEPATGAALEKVAARLQALTRSTVAISEEVAAIVDRELIATNMQVQAAGRHYRETLLAELRSRIVAGDFRKAPLNPNAIDAINGPRETRPNDERLMAHTAEQGFWYVDVWLYRSTAPRLAAAHDDLKRQKQERDQWAARRVLELLE